MNFTKNDLKTIVTINLFGLTAAVSFISSNGMSTLFLKLFCSIILYCSFMGYAKSNEVKIQPILITIFSRKTFGFWVGLILMPMISLVYSVNPNYGFIKLFSLLIIGAPLIIVFAMMMSCYNEAMGYWIKFSAMIWSVVIVCFMFILKPININGLYHFSPYHWSHVMVGRVLFCLLLILLSFYKSGIEKKEKRVLLFMLMLLGLGLFMSSLRAAIAGMILFTPLFLGTGIYKKYCSLKDALILLVLLTFACAIAVIKEQNTTVNKRLEWVREVNKGELNKEGSFRGRMQSFQICKERFIENPVLGIGFGGFFTPYKNYKAWALKYPHNIILEYAVEMGSIGLLWLFAVLWLLVKGTWKMAPAVFLFFAGLFWLSLFSKDIPSNMLFFCGVMCYFMKPRNYDLAEA